jgi:hypothetical protein
MLIVQIDRLRRLCIEKDLKEMRQWVAVLEAFNTDLDCFLVLEKQLIHNVPTANLIKSIRRKNVLHIAALCKYEQELKNEYEFGDGEYDAARSKKHDKNRMQYQAFVKECEALKKHIYQNLMRYQRK